MGFHGSGAEIRFVIELQSASPSDSHLGWGKLRSHTITAEFVEVDAPFAWAAQQHGCHLLDNDFALLRSSLNSNNPAHSADGWCDILRSCNTSSNNTSQHNPGCALYGPQSKISQTLNDAFQATSNVMKLMACFDSFCGARLETSGSWFHPVGQASAAFSCSSTERVLH